MSPHLVTRVIAADDTAAQTAARVLALGGLVAFPTETVYGLGADAGNGTAVAKLYAAKGRPSFNPLIAHITDTDAARQLAVFNAEATTLAAAFWPGPLTLVLPKQPGCPISDLATAGLETVALRVPNHPAAQAILRAFGRAVVAPSANRSGQVSPTDAAHVLSDLEGRIDLIVDGGPTSVGVESTIVACTDNTATLLRPGGVPRAEIERVLGHALAAPSGTDEQAPRAPGMLASHYAPRATVRLDATAVAQGEAVLAFGPTPPANVANAVMTLNLSPSGDTIEAAANLFSFLRALDHSAAPSIAVMPIPDQGLGEAINDRLRRAAAPRG